MEFSLIHTALSPWGSDFLTSGFHLSIPLSLVPWPSSLCDINVEFLNSVLKGRPGQERMRAICLSHS